jgi:hypothetical protein
MKNAARVSNAISGHSVEVETEGRKQSIAMLPYSEHRYKHSGFEIKGDKV